MAKDRAKNDRRSVGSHEKMTAALGRAAGWKRAGGIAMTHDYKGTFFAPGHGHVTTGTQSHYDPQRLGTVHSTSFSATKGL